jgi:hypothetical protein
MGSTLVLGVGAFAEGVFAEQAEQGKKESKKQSRTNFCVCIR